MNHETRACALIAMLNSYSDMQWNGLSDSLDAVNAYCAAVRSLTEEELTTDTDLQARETLHHAIGVVESDIAAADYLTAATAQMMYTVARTFLQILKS